MANYDHIFLYRNHIVKSTPGVISLGAVHKSVALFSFEIPVFNGDLLYLVGKELFELTASKEAESKKIRYCESEFEFVKNPDQKTITMTMNQKSYTFENKFHLLSFIKCLPVMACQAAVSRNLVQPLIFFCRRLYEKENDPEALLLSQHQFAAASLILLEFFCVDEDPELQLQLLVFIEVNYSLVSSVVRLQKVLNNCFNK
jgi:hypothetical protein